jgi:putative transposase
MTTYEEAGAALVKISGQLERINPSAARSLEEGMEETLTLHRLGVSRCCAAACRRPTFIEFCLSTVRQVAHNVKRWQGDDHVARWAAAGLLEAEKKFRKVKGYRELKELATKLNPHSTPQQQVA